jgi:protein O-mannosyl-transferase
MKNRSESVGGPSSWRDGQFAVALAALLGSVVGCLYARALTAPFIYDDATSIVANHSIRRLWPLVGDAQHPGPLSLAFNNTAVSGRPLVNLSFALNYQFGNLNPLGYRLVNLGLHVASAVLLALIIRRTLRLDHFSNRFERSSGSLAFLIALLWAVHPLQSEAVVYLSQRTELLMACCYLGTMYCSQRYWAAASPGRRSAWLTLAAILCAAGMASKEVMVSAPIAVLLFDRAFLAKSLREAWRRSWPLYVALGSGWALLVLLNVHAPRSASAGFRLGVPPHVWWMTQAKVSLLYLKLCIWPWPLTVHYQVPYLNALGNAWIYLLAVTIILAAILAALWKNYAVGFLGACVVMILSPTFVVPIVTEVAAERRMYLPLAAVVTLIVLGAFHGARLLRIRLSSSRDRDSDWPIVMAVAIPSLLLASALSLVTVRRLAAYESELTLWQDVVAQHDDDWVAHNDVASELFKQGRLDEALGELQAALRLNPTYAPAQSNYGNILLASGKPEEAIKYFQQAVSLAPDFTEAQNNLGLVLEATGKIQQAKQQYQVALQTGPAFIEAHLNLARVLLNNGESDEALAHYRQAADLEPDDVRVHFDYAKALFTLHRATEAIDQYRDVLRLRPDLASAENNLGIALTQVRQYSEAVAHFNKSIQLEPNDAETYLNCGIALLLVDRPQEAIDRFERALKIKPDDAQVWVELAKALSAAGKSPEATAAAKKALELARAQGQDTVAAEVEVWLKDISEKGPQH